MSYRRVEIPPLRLCVTPLCPNELDTWAPSDGEHAGECADCRRGLGLAIEFHQRTKAWRSEGRAIPVAPPVRRRGGRPTRSRSTTPTDVELLVLRGIALGLSNDEIAATTGRAVATVKSHVKHLLWKLEAPNRARLVAVAYEQGLLP